VTITLRGPRAWIDRPAATPATPVINRPRENAAVIAVSDQPVSAVIVGARTANA
jgi:hypothetical protein